MTLLPLLQMAFSEKTKRVAKERAAFRCCICHRPFVEVHHIVPQVEGGDDTIDNAAPLCSSCHDLYGGNPEKRKIIRQMRNHWWKLMEQREKNLTQQPVLEKYAQITEEPNHKGSLRSKGIVIYHLVLENEDFIIAATHIHKLILDAQNQFPNRSRFLYLDIDGHRNEKGGFDKDMYELQRHFLLGFMTQYLSRLYIPLVAVQLNKPQRNDVPDRIDFIEEVSQDTINKAIDEKYSGIWVSDKDKWISIDEAE